MVSTTRSVEALGLYFGEITLSYFSEFTKDFNHFQEYIREVKQFADKVYGRTVKKADLLEIALKTFEDSKISNSQLDLAKEVLNSWRHTAIKEPPKELAWLYRGISKSYLKQDRKIKAAQNRIISKLESIVGGEDKEPDAETIRGAIRKTFNRREFEQIFAHEVPKKKRSGEAGWFRSRYPIKSDDEIQPRLEFLAEVVLKSTIHRYLADRFVDEIYRR